MSEYSRRDILRCLALGGAVVAGELWIPGQRLISIPTLNDGIALNSIAHPWLVDSTSWRLNEKSLEQICLEMTDIAYMKYQDVFVACYHEGGAIKTVHSKDGMLWTHITRKELFVDA